MILNLNTYKKNIQFIKFVIDNKSPTRTVFDVVSEASTVIHVPIICCYIFYAHLYGMNKEIQDKIDFLKTFYGITDIIGLENFPYEV